MYEKFCTFKINYYLCIVINKQTKSWWQQYKFSDTIMTKTYYHYCVDVFYFDDETQEYKLWFKESFSSKQNFEIWADGFAHGTNKAECPVRVKLGEPYVKYREYKPKF